MSLRSQLLKSQTPSTDSPSPQQMSPLAQRFNEALNNIAKQSGDPKLAMVLSAFNRHLSKHPMTDQDITEALSWIKQMVDTVLDTTDDSIHPHQHAETMVTV